MGKVTCEAYTDRGIVGPRGKSAYEQAVEGGYTGTEEEFEAALASDINTVAGSISDVNTVGANISDVQTVAGVSSDVSTVAGISSDVSAVSSNATNISTVAGIATAVNNVASNESAILNVSDNLVNVNTIASNMNSVLATAGDIANIDAVAGNKTNIDTVAGISSDVSAVASVASDISEVKDNATNINTVATNISDVNTVATNISNVNTAASNMSAIIAAPTQAANAATSASNAQKWAEGSDADVAPLGGTKSSKGWAARAQEIAESIGAIYKPAGSIAFASLPALSADVLGNVYNITDAFTTTADFVEGAGKNYPAGTNVAIVDVGTGGSHSYKFDVLSGFVDLSAYRTSSAQDVIDAGKADNTNKVNGIPLSTANAYYYGESTSAADAVQKEVSIPAITALNAGQVIIVKPTITSTVASSTLKLNSFDAYPMLYAGATITTSTDSKVWSANTPSIFVFDGSYWRFAGHGADDNTTYTLNYVIYAGTANAGVGDYAVTRYALLMQKLDGTWETLKETSTNYSTGTTKTVNTNGFIPSKITYYNTTTVKKNGEAIGVSSLYLKSASVDARYSFNCGATPNWSAGDRIYLVGTIGTDGLFYLDSTTWWANALPTTQDGKVYMYIGTYVSDAYKITLDLDHPMYYHDGTSVKQYVVAGNKLDASAASNFVDLATADQQITAQKIVRNNWVTNALYILANISGWTWYKALSWTGSRIRVGDSSNIGLQLETNESTIKAKIGANTYDVLTTADKGTANGVAELDSNGKVPVAQLSAMIGADGVNAGTAGLVPAPTATDNNKFLKGDGTWDNPAGGGSSRNVGETVESTVPLTDAGLHLLDGSLLSGSGSYADFVTYMAGVYADHPELFTTEADWQTSVTNYGVCGKFVYDSVNNTVRLPKKSSTERHLVKSTVSGTDWCDVYSDGWCEQGGVFTGDFATGNQFALLTPYKDTNYTVITNALQYNTTSAACFGVNTKTTTYFAGEAFRSSNGNIRVGTLQWEAKGYIDASNLGSETIYQYIVIANSTKTEIEVDIDEIATDLNGKADVDLTNVSGTSGFRKLIEVYNNGVSWYKVYAEYNPSTGAFIGNWCEQGGRTVYSTTGTETVALLKEMRDTNYLCQVTLFADTSGSTSSVAGQYHTCWDLTTTSFKHQRYNAQIIQQMWKVEGYLA